MKAVPIGLKIGVHRNGGYGDGLITAAFMAAVLEQWHPAELHAFGNLRTMRFMQPPFCTLVSELLMPDAKLEDEFDLWIEAAPVPAVRGRLGAELFPVPDDLAMAQRFYRERDVAGVVAFYEARGCVGVAEMLSSVTEVVVDLRHLAPYLSGAPAVPKRQYVTLGAGLVGDKHACKTPSISKWHEIARWLGVQGFEVFQLGAEGEMVIDGAQPLTHLPMQRQLWILAHAWAHVGADGFLNHAAAVFDIPTVALWGVTPRIVWGHHLHHHVTAPRAENFWLSRAGWWKKDFDKCRKIMNGIPLDDVMAAVKEALTHGNKSKSKSEA